MSGTEILLVAGVLVIPLAIAVAVTLWTLEPAAQRAERAKRGRHRSQAAVAMNEAAGDPSVLNSKTEEVVGVEDSRPRSA